MPAHLARLLPVLVLLPLAARARPPGEGTPPEPPLLGAEASARVAQGLAVDAVFAPWSGRDRPGCAVGVARGGEVVLARGYGMANLELGVPNTPDTVFEAGSVSKQLTAAAVMLLVGEGRLALDAPVRTWLPELDGPGGGVNLRQMLHHTSGLRDWGTVVEAAGWPRGTRALTQAHVLDVMRRQRALNYRPDTEYLYSNSGYTLAALAVERASGQPFPDFTRARLFAPLGMAHTRWRADFTEVVPGRATAYSQREGVWHTTMPFEDVIGHGGLLTTVKDLLRWNENFEHPTVGGRALVERMQERARLVDGRQLGYAMGLVYGRWRGVLEVSHSGATAGYRAYLARYPDQHLSVALLCNAAEARPEALARGVAEVFLGRALGPDVPAGLPAAPAQPLPDRVLSARAGLYLNLRTREPLRLVATPEGLQGEGVGTLAPVSGTVFQGRTSRAVFALAPDGTPRGLRMELVTGDTVPYAPAAPPVLTPARLAAYRGSYTSDEAEATYAVGVEGGGLVLSRRPGVRFPLEPLYADAFRARGLGIVTFLRDAGGRVRALSLSMDRVRDLRFVRAAR